jgi:hypothetical protein
VCFPYQCRRPRSYRGQRPAPPRGLWPHSQAHSQRCARWPSRQHEVGARCTLQCMHRGLGGRRSSGRFRGRGQRSQRTRASLSMRYRAACRPRRSPATVDCCSNAEHAHAMCRRRPPALALSSEKSPTNAPSLRWHARRRHRPRSQSERRAQRPAALCHARAAGGCESAHSGGRAHRPRPPAPRGSQLRWPVASHRAAGRSDHRPGFGFGHESRSSARTRSTNRRWRHRR